MARAEREVEEPQIAGAFGTIRDTMTRPRGFRARLLTLLAIMGPG